MTSFNTLFNWMFQEKSKTVYLIFLIQTFASVCFTIISLLTTMKSGGNPQIVNGSTQVSVNGVTSFLFLFSMFMGLTSFVASFIYWIVSSVKNEKINRSQTWRLVPISDTKFLLSNFGSAFLTYIWLDILEAVTVIIAMLPMFLNQGIQKELKQININFSVGDWKEILSTLCLVILLGYAWYAIISLLNLSSRSVIDFLPGGSSNFWTFVIRIVVIIAVIWLLCYAVGVVASLLGKLSPLVSTNDINTGSALLKFLAFDVVITLIDILLLNKFVEAKQN